VDENFILNEISSGLIRNTMEAWLSTTVFVEWSAICI